MKKVKVKVLRNTAKPWPVFKENEIATLDEAAANEMVLKGLAEHVDTAVATPAAIGPEIDDLESKTVVELHDLAKAESINLHGANVKDDIVKAIRKGRKK